MATMKVDGRQPLEVPAYLGGVAAAGNGQRILYRIVDTVILTVLWGMYVLLPVALIGMIPYFTANLVLFVMLVAYAVGSLVMLVRRGQTPGMAMCHARWVRFDTGGPAGKAGLKKYLLESVMAGATLGIAPLIVWFTAQDDANRHWFDRTCGTLTLDLRAGRDPQIEASAVPVVAAKKVDSVPPRPWEAAKSLDSVGGRPPAPPLPPPPSAQPAYGPPAPVLSPGSMPARPVSVGAPNVDSRKFIGDVPWASAVGGALRPPPPPFAGVAADDVLDHTIARQPADTVLLRFDNGSEHVLAGTVVVGRDPVADAAHPGASGLPISDPDRSISKTHLALTSQDGGVWVEDLHSTNGTQVESPSGVRNSVLTDYGVLATTGSVIHFGERSVTVGA